MTNTQNKPDETKFSTYPQMRHNPSMSWSRKYICEIFDEIASAPNDQTRIQLLRRADSDTLRRILKGAFDRKIVWSLPKGSPPGRKRQNVPVSESLPILVKASKNFAIYVDGDHNKNFPKYKRELHFLQLLESIDMREADMLIAVKDQELNVPGLTPALINAAFPNLIVDPVIPVKEKSVASDLADTFSEATPKPVEGEPVAQEQESTPAKEATPVKKAEPKPKRVPDPRRSAIAKERQRKTIELTGKDVFGRVVAQAPKEKTENANV